MNFLKKKTGRIILSLLFVGLLTWGGLYWYWKTNYQNRIYPDIKIGDIALGGANWDQANLILTARAEKITDAGLTFIYDEQTEAIDTSQRSLDAASSYPLLTFDIAEMLAATYNPDDNFLTYLRHLIKPASEKIISARYELNEVLLEAWLEEKFGFLNLAPANAHFALEKDGQEEVLVRVPEQSGQALDKSSAIEAIKTELAVMSIPSVAIKTLVIEPELRQEELLGSEEEIKKIIQQGPIIISAPAVSGWLASKKEWRIPPQIFTAWLQPSELETETTLSLDTKKVEAYLTEYVAPQTNQEPVLPRLEVKGGRISLWQTGKPGYDLLTEDSAQKIAQGFFDEHRRIEIQVQEIPPAQVTATNDFKITEIIGVGHSSFAGSPNNRRHNIKVGADALHGLLIKPGEEFSLVKALGEINAATGYLPELVIKGNRTIPEYGGGLCQIGTTLFRSALGTGLPITERRNHSYRVSYYEPAGTDATIYNPSPDFRFANDTGNYILIQARIEGDDLYFDFWGTSDGRTASTTQPVIYNIVKAPPTKIIETDELAPGERKCTEKAHDGASAYFDYTVIYPEGATTTPVQTRRFHSRYVPWQAVCLVGKAAAEEEASEQTDTGNINESDSETTTNSGE